MSTIATTAGVDLRVRIGELELQNPVMPASGCFGPELGGLIPLERLGAVVTKTVFHEVRSGNPAHRLGETRLGALNSVGIPSPGGAGFRDGLLREYQASGTRVIVSIGGLAKHEYDDIAADLADERIDAFELNLSCPNLEHPGPPIGTSAAETFETVQRVRGIVDAPILAKLSPSVPEIAPIALAAQEAGADAIVVANSFTGLGIDLGTRRSALGVGSGGYTGPAIKPIAVRLVRDAAAVVDIPVIGCGGAATAHDVAEFMVAGATAVQIGTATFGRPAAMIDAIDDLPELCLELGVSSVVDLIGSLEP